MYEDCVQNLLVNGMLCRAKAQKINIKTQYKKLHLNNCTFMAKYSAPSLILIFVADDSSMKSDLISIHNFNSSQILLCFCKPAIFVDLLALCLFFAWK